MKRTREQSLATRATIVDAAQQKFYENGVARTSLEDIARHAGMTRGAIYGHFRNKIELFEAMFEQAALPLDPFFASSHESGTNPLEGLIEELCTRWRHAISPGPARLLYTISITRCENARETAAFYARAREAGRRAEEQIQATLCRAVIHQQLPAQFDTRSAARILHATLSGLLRKQLIEVESGAGTSIDIAQIIRSTCAALARMYPNDEIEGVR